MGCAVVTNQVVARLHINFQYHLKSERCRLFVVEEDDSIIVTPDYLKRQLLYIVACREDQMASSNSTSYLSCAFFILGPTIR